MIEMQKILPEMPAPAADLLSDLLDGMHLAGTVLFLADFHEPWSVDTPKCDHIARILPFRTEYIIPFHVVASGGCWLDLPQGPPVWLHEGDAVVLPYGHMHRLRGRVAANSVALGDLLPRPPWDEIPVVEYGGAGDVTHIVCGFLQCDELLFHPVLHSLPPLLHVSPGTTPADRWLAMTIRHTAAEAGSRTPGSRAMLPRLTELMFVEILRNHMQALSANEVGWFAACNDALVGGALRFFHSAPLEAWSLGRLARRVGASRTVLAERFKHFLGLPPMQYLVRWRLQLAAQKLKTSELPVKSIADEIGYESEASFSRAFRRQFGVPPGEWRKRQHQRS